MQGWEEQIHRREHQCGPLTLQTPKSDPEYRQRAERQHNTLQDEERFDARIEQKDQGDDEEDRFDVIGETRRIVSIRSARVLQPISVQRIPQGLVHLPHVGRVRAERVMPLDRERGKIGAVDEHQRGDDYKAVAFPQKSLQNVFKFSFSEGKSSCHPEHSEGSRSFNVHPFAVFRYCLIRFCPHPRFSAAIRVQIYLGFARGR